MSFWRSLVGKGNYNPSLLTPANKVSRPWGWFQVLWQGDGWQVKLLHVEPKQATSLQQHKHRVEQWSVVSGNGIVTIGAYQHVAQPPRTFIVNLFQSHQIDNPSDVPLEIVEVQSGEIDEYDIIRLADRYGRV